VSSSPGRSVACSAPSNANCRRRSAIEPVMGHMQAEGHPGRCYLMGTAGHATNAILTAVGHNLRLVLTWLRTLLRLILIALWRRLAIHSALKLAA